MDNVFEVTGLGKGLGSMGAKISKAAGLPGMDVSSGVKPVQPQKAAPQTAAEEPELTPEERAQMTPEEAAELEAEENNAPETVEKLPKPIELEYDKLGAPNKNKLTGHVVRRDDKEYVLDWDEDFDVYKLVDPQTLRVKTRVRPSSVSTVDFRAGTIREAVADAVDGIRDGIPVSSLVSRLLNGQ